MELGMGKCMSSVDLQAEAKEGHPYIFISHAHLVRIKHRQVIGR